MEPDTDETGLQQFAAQRRDSGRTTDIHVVGDTDADPPEGRAKAVRAAHIVQAGEGSIIDYDPADGIDVEDLADDSVLVVTLGEDIDYDLLGDLEALLRRGRRLRIHLVVHAPGLTKRVDEHLDARVYAEDNRVVRLQRDDFSTDVYEVEIGWGDGGE